MCREIWGGSRSHKMSWGIRKVGGEMKLSVKKLGAVLGVNMAIHHGGAEVETEQKWAAWCTVTISGALGSITVGLKTRTVELG